VIDMDENRIEGAARNAAGKVQKTLGSVTGDEETEGKGMAQEAVGQAQNLYGNAMDSVRDQPLSALLIAGGIGMALGVLIGRR
jgi:uncharacterized protein YjbJ (UPF0337 family)